jgi:hypothetical protein
MVLSILCLDEANAPILYGSTDEDNDHSWNWRKPTCGVSRGQGEFCEFANNFSRRMPD